MDIYFAVEMLRAQSSPHNLELVGTFLDYYIVKVPKELLYYVDFKDLDPIPLTEEEARCHWFVGAYQPYVKIQLDSWDDFGRDLPESYEVSAKGKIKYFYTEEEDELAASLMKKIITRKLDIYINTLSIFDMFSNYHSKVEFIIRKGLRESTKIEQMNDVYWTLQACMYEEKGEFLDDFQRSVESQIN